jgi:hypothetical protein
MSSQQAQIDALFALAPEEFTAARDRLARELSDRGNKDAGKEVKGLKRPTVAAWAVNQTVRGHPDAFERLTEAGRELSAAQRRAASGLASPAFAKAMAARRKAVRELTELAGQSLTDAGRAAEPHLGAISNTFEAAASDRSSQEIVAAGRLSKELAPPSGFDVLEGFTVVPGAGERPSPAEAATAAATRDVERWRTKSNTAREEHRSRQGQAEEAEQRVQELEAELERARREAAASRKRADRAGEKAADAERKLEEAAARLGNGGTAGNQS